MDYLTCTFNEDADHTRLSLYLSRIQRREIRDGNMVHSWGLSGYTGERVGGLEWGYRHDGAIVRLSGFSAQRYWKRFGKIATNCSRIDLQHTVLYDEQWSKTIARHWREMKRWHLGGKRRPKPKVIAGPHGPETIYSGARVSDVFLRLYHRGSRPGYAQCAGHVRYEVEVKDKRALCALTALVGSEAFDADCDRLVATWFRNRGCRLMWREVGISRIRAPIIVSDVQRQLRWLTRAVKPAVQGMIAAGHRDEVLVALGLPTWSSLGQSDSKEE